MKLTEKILGLLAVLGIITKLLQINGHGLLIVIGFTGLALIYNFLSFAFFNDIKLKNIFKKEAYKGLAAVRIIGTIVFGFALSMTTIEVLFKLQSYIGAGFGLIAGLASLFICLIVIAIRYSQTKSSGYKKMLIRIAIIGGLALLLFITPTNVLFDILHPNQPDYVQALKKLNTDPNNPELWAKVYKLRTPNDKLIMVKGVTHDDMKETLMEVCHMYNKEKFKVIPSLTKISDTEFAVTFPFDIHFNNYCYVINYIKYPKSLGSNREVTAWATIKSADEGIPVNSANKRAMIYISNDNSEHNNVYMTTESNENYKFTFTDDNGMQPVSSQKTYSSPTIAVNSINEKQPEIFK